jgi:hypothetical protein
MAALFSILLTTALATVPCVIRRTRLHGLAAPYVWYCTMNLTI